MFTGSLRKMSAGKTRWRITLWATTWNVQSFALAQLKSQLGAYGSGLMGQSKWVTPWESLLQITWSKRSRELSHLKTPLILTGSLKHPSICWRDMGITQQCRKLMELGNCLTQVMKELIWQDTLLDLILQTAKIWSGVYEGQGQPWLHWLW